MILALALALCALSFLGLSLLMEPRTLGGAVR